MYRGARACQCGTQELILFPHQSQRKSTGRPSRANLRFARCAVSCRRSVQISSTCKYLDLSPRIFASINRALRSPATSKKPHDRIAIEASKSFRGCGSSIPPKGNAAHAPPLRDSSGIVSRVSLSWGSQKVVLAGSAAPPLNAPLTEVAELFADLVLAFGAGHGLFSA